ncbi:MAG: hypothetical protein ACOY46_05190 [Bacillota bacterium]
MSEFEDILRDQSNEDRQDDALRFYRVNQEEMDRGVEVLGPSALST